MVEDLGLFFLLLAAFGPMAFRSFSLYVRSDCKFSTFTFVPKSHITFPLVSFREQSLDIKFGSDASGFDTQLNDS